MFCLETHSCSLPGRSLSSNRLARPETWLSNEQTVLANLDHGPFNNITCTRPWQAMMTGFAGVAGAMVIGSLLFVPTRSGTF